MTRGRESNTAHVVTGNVAPPGTKPYRQAAPESVLADVLQRDGEDLSATGQIHQAQDWAGGTGHLLTLWSAAVRLTLYPAIDEQITARLTESEAWRYQREPSRPVLQHALREAQLAGHDIGAVIDRITAGPMDGARSVASVLHGRLQRLQLQPGGPSVTWAQRTPGSAPALAHDQERGSGGHTADSRRRPCRALLGGSPDGRAATAGPAGPHPQVCGTRPLSSANGRACKTGPHPSSVPGMLLLSTIPVKGAPVSRVSDGASRHP